MAKTVGGHGELHRHVGVLLVPVVPEPHELPRAVLLVLRARQQLAVELWADDPSEEVVGDDPLVVPLRKPLGSTEDLALCCAAGTDKLDARVMQPHEGDMELADDPVLVIAGITNYGEEAQAWHVETVGQRQLGVVAGVVLERLVVRSGAVDAVQVERGVRKFIIPAGSLRRSSWEVGSKVMS